MDSVVPVTRSELTESFEFNPHKTALPPKNLLFGRTVYNREQHGDIVAFCAGPKGKALKKEFLEGVDDIGEFLHTERPQHTSDSLDPQLVSSLELFKDRVAQRGDEADYFSSHYPLIAGAGKYNFDRILAAVKDPHVASDDIYSILADFPQSVTVCSAGTITNLIDIAQKIDAATGDVEHAFDQAYRERVEALLLGHVHNVHSHETAYEGNEIHYVNGYRNYFARRLAFKEIHDPFVPSTTGNPENLNSCEKLLEKEMSASSFIDQLSDAYLDHWKNLFPEPLSFEDLGSDRFRTMIQQLERRFGGLSYNDLLEYDDIKETYALRQDQTLLKHDLADRLQKVGFLKQFKTSRVAHDAIKGHEVKQAAHLLYVKSQVGSGSFERRPLQNSDFSESWITCTGATPLLFSAMRLNNTRGVCALLDSHADANAIDRHGYSALSLAVHNDKQDIVRALIAAKADVNAKNGQGLTALMLAVQYDFHTSIDTLISANADVNANDSEEMTALLHAVKNDNCAVIDALISAKANVNAQDIMGFTPLMYAALHCQKEAFGMLLDAGADVNVKTKDGSVALMFAAIDGDREIVNALIAAKADVNAKSESEHSALMVAVMLDQKNIVDALITAEADVNAKDCDGLSVLSLAVQHNTHSVIDALVRANVDVNSRDVAGFTSLMHAVKTGRMDIVETLLKAQAKADLESNDGSTALSLAELENRKDMVAAIIAAIAHVNPVRMAPG